MAAEFWAGLITAGLFSSLPVSLAPALTSEAAQAGKTLGRALEAGSARGGWQWKNDERLQIFQKSKVIERRLCCLILTTFYQVFQYRLSRIGE